MTEPTPPEVEQIDRDAAADLMRPLLLTEPYGVEMFKAGDHDNDRVVQAFARHRLTAQASAGASGVEWRPIETAPKDGTVIDVWRDEGGRDTVFWGFPAHDCGEMASYCDSDWHRIEKPGWICSTFGEFVGGKHNPYTHWMPLPAPPGAIPSPSSPAREEVIHEGHREVARLGSREALWHVGKIVEANYSGTAEEIDDAFSAIAGIAAALKDIRS